MNIKEALREATSRFRSAGISEPGRDASVLLTHVFSGDREIQYREPEKELSGEQIDQYLDFIDRRCSREPISHIVEVREFWSRDFIVNKHVLDPRPDSETLIEAVLQHVGDDQATGNILDLGTGSGCLVLTLLAELTQATGVGVDISLDAIKVASRNAVQLGLANRVKFVQSSWFEKVSGQYGIIISNPPYIEKSVIETLQPEVKLFEPIQALDGGDDGLDCYRLIISNMSSFLKDDGFAIFEVGKGQADDVVRLMKEIGFISIKVHVDLASVGRCVSGKLKSNFLKKTVGKSE